MKDSLTWRTVGFPSRIMSLERTESPAGDVRAAAPGQELLLPPSPCIPGESSSTATTNVLTPKVLEKLAGERTLVSEFKQLKLEREAQKNWDLFYKRNTTNFFKDRHWTTREFEELRTCREVREEFRFHSVLEHGKHNMEILSQLDLNVFQLQK